MSNDEKVQQMREQMQAVQDELAQMLELHSTLLALRSVHPDAVDAYQFTLLCVKITSYHNLLQQARALLEAHHAVKA